jgi:uncharacterized protein (TIGR00369 family)
VGEWKTQVGFQMPAEELMGVRMLDAAPGSASGAQAGPDIPELTLGCVGVLADATGGRPVAFSLPPGQSISTVSMHLDLLHPLGPPAPDGLSSTGRLLQMSATWALSEFTITGAGGDALVVGNTRFVIYPEGAEVPAAHRATGEPQPPATDLLDLLDMNLVRAADGAAEATFTPLLRHANPYWITHGGLHTALVDAVMSAAVASVSPGMTLLTLDLSYHRPIPVDGVPVSVTASVAHRGRRVVLAEAVVAGPDGKSMTTARGTFGLVEG